MGPLRSPIGPPSRNSILTIPRSREGGQGRAPRPDGIDTTRDAGAARIAATTAPRWRRVRAAPAQNKLLTVQRSMPGR